MKVTSFIVSTDLDGTLLDHHTYDWQAAIPAIEVLQQQQIPIILNTSKTLQESITLQKKIGIQAPLIIENGSALVLPTNIPTPFDTSDKKIGIIDDKWQVITFGCSRKEILSFISEQRKEYGNILAGFNDWSLEEIAKRTGLSIEQAEESSKKLFSEPFIWLADNKAFSLFEENAKRANLQILQGGRFYHLQGKTDKATPLLWLKEQYQKINRGTFGNENINDGIIPKLICLGDNKNDIAMLNIADFPVCIKSPTSDYPNIDSNNNTIYTEAYGPSGWTEAITKLTAQIQQKI